METMGKVDEGRKREIEAAIVRTLKNKKSIQVISLLLFFMYQVLNYGVFFIRFHSITC